MSRIWTHPKRVHPERKSNYIWKKEELKYIFRINKI